MLLISEEKHEARSRFLPRGYLKKNSDSAWWNATCETRCGYKKFSLGQPIEIKHCSSIYAAPAGCVRSHVLQPTPPLGVRSARGNRSKHRQRRFAAIHDGSINYGARLGQLQT